MGVTGLWKLVEQCGSPVPVEALEGKILAVDISIWLHQVVKGYQDSKGSLLPHAHLLGLFHRLCKLLYYRVRPIFVFDGCVPQIKRDTIIRRQIQRSKLNSEADRIQTLLLQSLAKEQVVQQALGINAELLIKSPSKRQNSLRSDKNENDDIFKLPEPVNGSETENEIKHDKTNLSLESSTSTDDSSFDDSNPWREYNANLQAIDVRSEHFKSLPPEVRHEILVDIKETRKQSSWGRLRDLPSCSDDFSSFQMKRLLKRRLVQQSIEETEKEMGGKTLTFTDLQNMFTEEGILDPENVSHSVKPVCSDEAVRFTLVRDLKNTTKNEANKNESKELSQTKYEGGISENQQENANEKYTTDLEMAIALSMNDNLENVYDEVDYEYESNEIIKLNRQQRNQLQKTAIGPARAYMIEYGGLNDEEIHTIADKTQCELASEDEETSFEKPASFVMYGEESGERNESLVTENKCNATEEDSQEICLKISDDSESDSDLERVDTNKPLSNASIRPMHVEGLKGDIFSDVLKSPNKETVSIDVKKPFQISTQTDADIFLSSDNKPPEECSMYGREGSLGIHESLEKNHETIEVSQGICIEVSDDSETDSDLEEVDANQPPLNNKHIKNLEITIRPKNRVDLEDDMFADIFISSKEETALNNENNLFQTFTKSDESVLFKRDINTSIDCGVSKQQDETEKSDNIKQTGTTKLAPNTGAAEDNKVTMTSILEDLKKQVGDIKNINLDAMNIQKSNISFETIEIYDSDDQKLAPVIESSKSPKIVSSKTNSINQYFETEYVIKRTPEKNPIEPEEKHTPGLKSPFFVKKLPLSQRKSSTGKGHQSSGHGQKLSKASKTLFKDSTSSKADNTQLISEDLLEKSVIDFKQQKTAEQLKTMATDLEKERLNLENERNRQDRMGTTINQNMHNDCQSLLKLFGIPYIIAPMEAEAQCAFLESAKLTDGTITDDSDIWLFGGRTVYKNFFEQNKHVLKFESDKIKQSFNCDREKLIQLACLVGSDYTTGIHGIGAVTALEILATFSSTSKGIQEKTYNSDVSTTTVIASLCRFRDWLKTQKDSNHPAGSTSRLNLRKKLKNIELYEGFPNPAVVDAYLNPTVDYNDAPFSWGYPEVNSIHEFTKKVFGWTRTKTDEILKPVLSRITEKHTQQSIRNYFTIKSAIKPRELKVSKRVQKAIDTMAGKLDDAESVSTKKKKVDQAHKREKKEKTQHGLKSTPIDCSDTKNLDYIPRTGAATEVSKFKPRIPETKEVIPQREKDKEKMRQYKKRAATLLRQTVSKTSTSKNKKKKIGMT
ncbi:DNA excision repair protein ERCC-5 homolog [Eurosta solidaginis]|uniref:DNA excision repair protein ERCC-5 homolog n=1 Tax=Eurosta solidaginis TaxID=178769 RepID=UPI003530DCB0